MFKTESLLAFVEVAKWGSFTAAAKVREQTPMAMSKQVSSLEKKLGEALFERSTRKVRLTEFGSAFLLRAQDILSQHDSLQQWIESRSGKLSGHLSVVTQNAQTYEETVFPFVAEFHQHFPELSLSFDIQEKIIDLESDPYDIYWGVSDYLGDRYPGLKRRSMWQAKYGIFAAPKYLEQYGVPVTPKDLSEHRMISYLHQQPDNVLVVNQRAHSKQSTLNAVEVLAPLKTVSGHSELAIQGLGLINAIADNSDIKRYLASGQLVPVLENYWYENAEVFIYYQQVKFAQPKVRCFIDFFLGKREKW